MTARASDTPARPATVRPGPAAPRAAAGMCRDENEAHPETAVSGFACPERLAPVVERLAGLALAMGASAAEPVSAAAIVVEDELAGFCLPPLCDGYGTSAKCPPHTSGPTGFRRLCKDYRCALVLKIEVPTEILLSHQRQEIYYLLHQIAAEVEKSARATGLPRARAFAGGCCKQIFCYDHAACRVLSGGGTCRHEEVSRPSMSGYGINVTRLVAAAGWSMDRITRDTDPDAVPTGSVTALVLID